MLTTVNSLSLWLHLIPLSTSLTHNFSVSWAYQDWSHGKAFVSAVPSAWNAFPSVFHRTESFSSFRSQLKRHLFLKPFPARPSYLRSAHIPSLHFGFSPFFLRFITICDYSLICLRVVSTTKFAVAQGWGNLHPIYHVKPLLRYQVLRKYSSNKRTNSQTTQALILQT